MTAEDVDTLLPCDLVSLSGMLKVCKLEMVLLDDKGPRAIVDSRTHNDALLCSAETSFPFRARLTLPADWCLLGYIHQSPGSSWCHGVPFAGDTAFTVMPEGSSEFMFSAGTRLTLLLLPLERVQTRLAELGPLHPLHGGAVSRLPPLFQVVASSLSARPLQALYQRIRQHLIHGPPPDGTVPVAPMEIDLDAAVDLHLAAALGAAAEQLPNCSRGRRKHYVIMQRAEQFMRANLRNDIYVNELCNAAGVSERALRYAFEDLLGISPNRYLSMLRLCTACRSLALADASRRSVKSVALSCGLWDLSRFADNYRRMFGELPHDTLMRSPPGDAAAAIS